MTDPSGATTYTYTNRDQVATKATPQGTLTYTHDFAVNVASTLSSNTNGANVTYAWDVNNRLSSVTDRRLAGPTTTHTYDATNQISSMTYPNSVVHSYSYDTRDRVLTLNGYTQIFSPSDLKQSVTETSGRAANYSYDTIYRLTNENIAGDPTAANNGGLAYSLDPVGNRLSGTSTLAALQSQASTFDANGNTLTSNRVTYSYEFEDRLD